MIVVRGRLISAVLCPRDRGGKRKLLHLSRTEGQTIASSQKSNSTRNRSKECADPGTESVRNAYEPPRHDIFAAMTDRSFLPSEMQLPHPNMIASFPERMHSAVWTAPPASVVPADPSPFAMHCIYQQREFGRGTRYRSRLAEASRRRAGTKELVRPHILHRNVVAQ